ncbi:MAG: hypothetical protein WD335_03720 [Candidatus Paceibacterota bacterium]
MITKKETKWYQDEKYIIELEVISNGMTGKQWYEKFSQAGYSLGQEYTVSACGVPHLLKEPQFNEGISNGIKYQLLIMKGLAFRGSHLFFDDVREEASRRGYSYVHPETACLVLDLWGKKGIEEHSMDGVIAMTEKLSRSLSITTTSLGEQLYITDVPMDRADPNHCTQGFMFQRK